MGQFIGKIRVETPKHETTHTSPDYEIRKYPPCVIAQVTYDQSNFNSGRDVFMILAKYIGALGTAQNAKTEKIAMTAPVITNKERSTNKEKVTMGLILPEKYKNPEDTPGPVDERVVIKEEGERKYGVVRFSWVAREDVVADKVEKLKACLERDGFKVVGDYLLARYNPPWLTLPMFRTNEVMIPVE